MKNEYRVVWQREGLTKKTRIYAKLASAERLVALMTSSEPWKLFDQDGDGYFCCSGNECGCGGVTVAEDMAKLRAQIPPLMYARIETRPVGAWTAHDAPS